jgi:hypothetical protein
MLELEGSEFYAATRSLRGLLTSVQASPQDEVIPEKARELIIPSIRDLVPHLDTLRAGVTWVQTTRVLGNLEDVQEMTYGHLADGLRQIDLRLQDELVFRKIFVVNEFEARYYESLAKMFSTMMFPSALYEIDEAGKCFALGRSTACVFHLMRTMEVGIRAVARCLGIPDPLKPAERNWGHILKTIKNDMDARAGATPTKTWNVKGDKQLFESAYASLDAVRAAWRNTTMHVDMKCTPDEAEHIFAAVKGFMTRLADRCDEDGQPPA